MALMPLGAVGPIGGFAVKSAAPVKDSCLGYVDARRLRLVKSAWVWFWG